MTDTRVPQSETELREHLSDQIRFLKSSGDAFDEGFDGESKRLAVTLRVLLHDTRTSHSLLGQLDQLDREFLSTAIPRLPGNELSHGGLVMIGAKGRDTKYLAMLDDVPFRTWLPFKEWWNQDVFVDQKGSTLSRKQLVLATANQDGGAHVDPALDEVYARLSRENSMGWVYQEGGTAHPIPKPERAAIRQIAHEVLRTLLREYSKKVEHDVEVFFGGVAVTDGPTPPSYPHPKTGRNEICPCGSGRKFKKCHGRAGRPN